MRGFEADFDDTAWSEAWATIPIVQAPAGDYPGGYRVERCALTEAEVFGRAYRLAAPMDCSFLYDPSGLLWMSNTPQERIMMYNNARHTWGRVLVGGLGLGLYPQYAAIGAAGEGTSFTVVEQSSEVIAIIEPVVRQALNVPIEVYSGRIEEFLARPSSESFDTVFLDTWETLDAVRLPELNQLRDLAIRHLSEHGRVLLWGYGWMVHLFEDACRQILSVPWRMRRAWLDSQACASPKVLALLLPVIEHFAGSEQDDLESALAWCRQHIVRVKSAAPLDE